MFAELLVCLDGSILSEHVMPCAVEIARRFRSQTILLQVLQVPSSLAAASESGTGDTVQRTPHDLVGEVHLYLESMKIQLEHSDVPAAVIVIEGRPGDAIEDYARINACDLIVVATRGR